MAIKRFLRAGRTPERIVIALAPASDVMSAATEYRTDPTFVQFCYQQYDRHFADYKCLHSNCLICKASPGELVKPGTRCSDFS
jgi:hypothetical protein